MLAEPFPGNHCDQCPSCISWDERIQTLEPSVLSEVPVWMCIFPFRPKARGWKKKKKSTLHCQFWMSVKGFSNLYVFYPTIGHGGQARGLKISWIRKDHRCPVVQPLTQCSGLLKNMLELSSSPSLDTSRNWLLIP